MSKSVKSIDKSTEHHLHVLRGGVIPRLEARLAGVCAYWGGSVSDLIGESFSYVANGVLNGRVQLPRGAPDLYRLMQSKAMNLLKDEYKSRRRDHGRRSVHAVCSLDAVVDIIWPSATAKLEAANGVAVTVAEFMSISFSHHMEILSGVKTLEERLFYIHETAQNKWKERQLRESIKRDDFHHRGAMPSNFAVTIPDTALARKTLAIRTPPWVSFSASQPTSRMSSTPYATTTSRWAWRPTERLTKCQRASNAHFRQSTNCASSLRSQG